MGDSSAITFVRHMFNHACEAHKQVSWTVYNRSLFNSLILAVESGMKFDLGDFDIINIDMRPQWWGGADERAYTAAVHAKNISALLAYEKFVGRKPFITNDVENPNYARGRVCVGSKFIFNNEPVTVTSFADDNKTIMACSYHPYCEIRKKRLVKKKYRISQADLPGPKDYKPRSGKKK